MTDNNNDTPIDISKNFFDLSRNIFFKSSSINNNNRQLFPLQHWDNKKINSLNKEEGKNIKMKQNIFNMKLDNVLNRMREDRSLNQNIRDYNFPFKNTINQLDKSPLLLEDKDRKKNLDDLLKRIDKHYNDVQAGRPTIPVRRRSSSYMNRRSNIFNIPQQIPLRVRPGDPCSDIIAAPPLPEKIIIDVEIEGIADILKLCEDYPLKPNTEYNINMKAIHNIRSPLQELNNMIGMNSLKASVVDQILYFIQDLHCAKDPKNRDFMHTVIYGPPGTGKTEVAKIMGKIFSKMGILSRNIFRKATRSDLIAGYLGQTALKTRDLIKECLGGVLFIDEAYALGNPEKRDSFAKECIDTLCEALSDYKDKLMVIVAGYEDELKNCFFSYNQGLDSRFTWRFKTTDYTPQELQSILQKKVKDAGWDFKEKIPVSWFEKNLDHFKFFGRDIETLFSKMKIAHSRRIFCKDKKERKKIVLKDLERGFEIYCKNGQGTDKEDNEKYAHLYL